MNSIFYKTVRSTGHSVWAPAPLGRKYEIGQTYHFPIYPAYVFQSFDDLRNTYLCRSEFSGGNRVLICYGDQPSYYPTLMFDVYEDDIWDFQNHARKHHWDSILGSRKFTVIGEIMVPAWWRTREDEAPNIKVINYDF